MHAPIEVNFRRRWIPIQVGTVFQDQALCHYSYDHLITLFAWLISHQPAVLLSQNKPAISNQPAVVFSQNKSAPAISHQPNEQAKYFQNDNTKAVRVNLL
jgi:hypothetical protein